MFYSSRTTNKIYYHAYFTDNQHIFIDIKTGKQTSVYSSVFRLYDKTTLPKPNQLGKKFIEKFPEYAI